jgi:hypothetical protein
MKFKFLALLSFMGPLCFAQVVNSPGFSGTAGGDLAGTYPNPTIGKLQGIQVGASSPSGGQVLMYNSSHAQWEPSSGSAPSGSAGGDLAGTYPNPTVAKIQGVSISTTSPTSAQVLTYNSSTAKWTPAASSGGITALTGDVTASGTGSVAASVVKIQNVAVASTSPTSAQVLTFNSSLSQWEPKAASGGGSPGGTSGAVQFNDGAGGFAGDDSYFTWDDSTHKLKVGLQPSLGGPPPTFGLWPPAADTGVVIGSSGGGTDGAIQFYVLTAGLAHIQAIQANFGNVAHLLVQTDGGALDLGNGGATTTLVGAPIAISGNISGDFLPNTNDTYNLGATTQRYLAGYFDNYNVMNSGGVQIGTLNTISGGAILNLATADDSSATSNMNISTGTVTVGTTSATSGGINVATGGLSGTDDYELSGSIQIQTGGVTSSGLNPQTGGISIGTGDAGASGIPGTMGLYASDLIWTNTLPNGLMYFLGMAGSGSDATGDFQVSTGAAVNGSSGNIQLFVGDISGSGTRGTIQLNGHIVSQGTAPSVSACGTGSPSVAGNDIAGRITVGGGAVTSCLLTFNEIWGTAPVCFLDDQSAALAMAGVATTSTLTVTAGSSFGSGILGYHCIGY